MIDALSHGPYELVISLTLLPHVDVERLMLTINNRLDYKEIKKFLIEEGILKDTEQEKANEGEQSSSILKAYLYCFFSTIILGLVYGYIWNILDDSFFLGFVIPVLGSLLIRYLYHKYYIEKSYNIFKRLVLGILSISIVVIGFISKGYLLAKVLPNPNNLLIIKNQIWLLMNDEVLFIFLSLTIAYVFFSSVFHGRTFKIQHKLNKLLRLYKKYGDYYCTKDGAELYIYLIDPEEIDKKSKDYWVLYINEGCLIEKGKKRPGGLYIPVEGFKEVSSVLVGYQLIFFEGKQYLYINLGNPENSPPKPYQLPLVVILDGDKEMITIQMSYYKDK